MFFFLILQRRMQTQGASPTTPRPTGTPPKASGLSKAEQQSLKRKGEKKLRDLRLQNLGKKKESELKHPITHKEIARRKKENK